MESSGVPWLNADPVTRVLSVKFTPGAVRVRSLCIFTAWRVPSYKCSPRVYPVTRCWPSGCFQLGAITKKATSVLKNEISYSRPWYFSFNFTFI